MADWDPSLYTGMPDRLDSPGPIPEEYSRQYRSLTKNTVETHGLETQPPTTTWSSVAQTSRVGATFLNNPESHSMPKPSIRPWPTSTTASGSGFSGVQGAANEHTYGMANATGRSQQEAHRMLQPPQQRVGTQHVHNNGNQYLPMRPSAFTRGQQPEVQQPYQNFQFQTQSQIQSAAQAQQRNTPLQSLQPSESRQSTSGSRRDRPSVKHLTCWWWNEKGQCKYSVDECLYAHHKTGKVADAPRQVKPGEPPVAGRKLARALQEEEERKRAPEREVGFLRAQNKALREAYLALRETTSQSLSTVVTMRQSVTRLSAEVVNVERDRARRGQLSATPIGGTNQEDAQMARALRSVDDQGLLAGVVEGQARARVARVEETLEAVGLGEVVAEGRRGM
ncbi:hypothetical protein BDDG_09070 [Blastomyces dermatitidis ATCC 18188]|uniref:C3H1-type domain-containing protein n=1 Tax=Ajellomyces dermatitidis (strain ATCC 18188 / CBS 674.68) TaxID=653446 RepID=F2TSB2_AJEDA|nr:hypothetical protein BDDG_09070 [Blastomyces dermatitidis ATCC 18188]